MERKHSPFRIERRLTPELFDHYVAKARAERSKAIAKFPGQFTGWLRRLRARGGTPAHTSTGTVRQLPG